MNPTLKPLVVGQMNCSQVGVENMAPELEVVAWVWGPGPPFVGAQGPVAPFVGPFVGVQGLLEHCTK